MTLMRVYGTASLLRLPTMLLHSCKTSKIDYWAPNIFIKTVECCGSQSEMELSIITSLDSHRAGKATSYLGIGLRTMDRCQCADACVRLSVLDLDRQLGEKEQLKPQSVVDGGGSQFPC